MPRKYGCLSCPLTFEIGWSRCNFTNGYGSEIFVVCISCGAQHAIRFALRDRGPESIQYFAAQLTAVQPAAHVPVMACLRHYLHLDLLGVRDALKNLPYQIGRDLTRDAANTLAAEYTEVGGTVELIFTG